MNTDKLLNRLLVYLIALVVALGIIATIRHYSHADTYMMVDTATQEIKSLSPEDDAQAQEGWEKIILPNEFKEIELQYHPTFYKWKNGKFVMNIKKISDVELAREEGEARLAEEVLVQKRMRKIAMDELKAEGVIFNYIEEG